MFVHSGRVGQRSELEIGDPVEFKRIAEPGQGGHQTGYRVLRTVNEWDVFFADHPARPRSGSIDFEHAMVLASYGDKDAKSLLVTNVIATHAADHVYVTEVLRGEGCPDEGAGTPFDLVAVPRVDKPVHFHVDLTRLDACDHAPPIARAECHVLPTPGWSETLSAPLGATVECEAKIETGSRPVTDKEWVLAELPKGSASKLTFGSEQWRATFQVDAIGQYRLVLEVTDDGSKKKSSTATIRVTAPTDDTFVELIWTNFTGIDDPDTFPRVELHAAEAPPASAARGSQSAAAIAATKKDCSLESPDKPSWCEATKIGPNTLLRMSSKAPSRYTISVKYIDDRYDKAPIVCARVFSKGALTNETCDAKVRTQGTVWSLGVLDEASGGYEVSDALDGGAPPSPSAAAPAPRDAGRPTPPPSPRKPRPPPPPTDEFTP